MNRFRMLAASCVVASVGMAAQGQVLIFSGVSTTSDDYQLGVVWSDIARDVGISMTVVENGTVTGMGVAAAIVMMPGWTTAYAGAAIILNIAAINYKGMRHAQTT